MNLAFVRSLGVMMKLNFERAVLTRVHQIEARPATYFRQFFFLCDVSDYSATAGENGPSAKSRRQAALVRTVKFLSVKKCTAIIANRRVRSGGLRPGSCCDNFVLQSARRM